MIQTNRNVASFNTIIEILLNDQNKIKLIRKYENTRKKIINNECGILFDKTCIYICINMYINYTIQRNQTDYQIYFAATIEVCE